MDLKWPGHHVGRAHDSVAGSVWFPLVASDCFKYRRSCGGKGCRESCVSLSDRDSDELLQYSTSPKIVLQGRDEGGVPSGLLLEIGGASEADFDDDDVPMFLIEGGGFR